MAFSEPKTQKALQLIRGRLDKGTMTWGLCINKDKKFAMMIGGFGIKNDFLDISDILALADYIRTLDSEIQPLFGRNTTVTDIGKLLLDKARKRNVDGKKS